MLKSKSVFLFIFITLIAYSTFASSAIVGKKNVSPKDNSKITSVNIAQEKSFKEIPANPDFSAMIITSVQHPSMEWWFHLPKNSTPHIAEIKKVFTDQRFSIFPLLDKASVKDGKFDTAYTISVTYPDNRKIDILKDIQFDGKKADKNILLACPEIVTAVFDQSYPEGKYVFEISAKDKLSGATSTAQTSVILQKWSPPNPFVGAKLVYDYIKGFYLQPSPEALYSIFFSNDFNLEQRGAPNSLNYTFIGFLKAAFERNKFLIPHIRESFSTLSDQNRAKVIFLFAILDEAPIDQTKLNDTEKNYQQRIRSAYLPNPHKKWDKVLGPAQIDMLYGEFFANGTYTPIRRIIDLLAYTEEADFLARQIEKKELPQDDASKEKIMLGMLNRTAIYSIARRAYEDPLIEDFCYWAIQNNDIPKKTSDLLTPIFKEFDAPQPPSPPPNQPLPSKKSPKKIELPKINIL